MRLLFVCTGNICRSPLAERLATAWADQRLGSVAANVYIASAGTDALDGRAMDKRSAAALTGLGGDPSGFAARTLVPEMATHADLVLTMTRRQRRLVLADAPRALRHTFTLPEAADLLQTADLRGLTELPLHTRARELAVRLNAGRAHRMSIEADDVNDPIGHSGSVHKEVGARIARKLRPLADILFAEGAAGQQWSPRPAMRQLPDLRELARPRTR
ncbi:arsenate reductase/protein-tyrosine-phosphatase family protein [Blastococcus sp. SYSU DS0973]